MPFSAPQSPYQIVLGDEITLDCDRIHSHLRYDEVTTDKHKWIQIREKNQCASVFICGF
jgi:hypothetical protein